MAQRTKQTKVRAERTAVPTRKSKPAAKSLRVEAVMEHARHTGLFSDKDRRIAGRVSAHLVDRAKERTGIRSDTELLAFALANIALEDNFADTFAEMAGTVDPNLDLEF